MFRVIILALLLMLYPTIVHATEIVGIRVFLVESGYSNDQITYDMDRKIVLLDGRDFYSTPPREDSKTYADKQILLELITDHRLGKYTVYVEAPIRMISPE